MANKKNNEGVRRSLNGDIIGPYRMNNNTKEDAEMHAKGDIDENFVRKNWDNEGHVMTGGNIVDKDSKETGVMYADPNSGKHHIVKDKNVGTRKSWDGKDLGEYNMMFKKKSK